MTKHSEASLVHVAYSWSYTDASARTAATGFVPADIGKLARQLDNNTLWMLTDDSPVTWIAVGGSSSITTDSIWDAKGDLLAGTGADAADKLTVGANGKYLVADSTQASGLKWETGGRILISSATPTGIGTHSFASIPAVYQKLIIEFVAKGTQSAASVAMDITLNNDTTDANYRQIAVGWYASTTLGAGAAGDNNIIEDFIIAASGPADEATYGIIEIPFYAGTTFKKQVRYRSGKRLDVATNHEHGNIRVMDWESTVAIDRVDLILSAGNFAAGTIINLYGEY